VENRGAKRGEDYKKIEEEEYTYKGGSQTVVACVPGGVEV
jgi:hypothetical protein